MNNNSVNSKDFQKCFMQIFWTKYKLWNAKFEHIQSTSYLLQRTGSVRSSSAFSNHELKAEAFLAKDR